MNTNKDNNLVVNSDNCQLENNIEEIENEIDFVELSEFLSKVIPIAVIVIFLIILLFSK